MWLVDSDEVWVPGVVVSLLTDGKMSVMREDSSSMVDDDQKSSVMDTSVNIPPLRNPELLLGANDLTTLSYLHEPAGNYSCCHGYAMVAHCHGNAMVLVIGSGIELTKVYIYSPAQSSYSLPRLSLYIHILWHCTGGHKPLHSHPHIWK